MRRTLLFFLFLLPASLLLSANVDDPSCSEGPVPAWVLPCDVPVEPVALKPSHVNLQYLLTDAQSNWTEKTRYYHYAAKALNQAGVSALGQFDIDFSPSFETVIIHAIRIYRGGVWLDRLHSARKSLLQRESELESDVYNGDLTLVYFLPDVREGDIVEYAFSMVGEMPHFSTRLTEEFQMQGSVAFERLYRRLLATPETPVNYRLFHTCIGPDVCDLSPTLRQWSWEFVETEPAPYEPESPSWYVPYARVQFSDYQSWKEVIDMILPIYALPEDAALESSEMSMQTQEWMQQTPSALQRAFLALRFVQEKVRYLGFEEGINGFKPTDPTQVFERRFGDCKDKAFLLQALLHMMGISSTPILVHSDLGKNLPDLLPTPFAFNHAILRIEIGGQEFYYVDATFYGQGGSSLAENFLPIYHWGLPISAKETGLVEIPGNYQEIATYIDTSIVLSSEDCAQVTICTTYQGYKADYMRRSLDVWGAQEFSEGVLGFLQKMYGTATIETPLHIDDDRERNVLEIHEHYQIPTVKSRGKKVLKVFSSTIRNYLDSGLNPERGAPYALIYPVWVKERIHIDNGVGMWEPDSDAYGCEHVSLLYSHSRSIEEHACDLHFELRHLQDHVPVDALREYWEITNEIEEDGYLLFQVKEAA